MTISENVAVYLKRGSSVSLSEIPGLRELVPRFQNFKISSQPIVANHSFAELGFPKIVLCADSMHSQRKINQFGLRNILILKLQDLDRRTIIIVTDFF